MKMLAERLQSGVITSPAVRLVTKLKIQQARIAQKLYASGDEQFLPLTQLNQAGIYHTPFFRIPDELKKTGVKRLFATCYDLIPIFKPEYCNEESIRFIIEFLDSITPETWILCISEFTRTELLTYMGNRIDPGKVIVTYLASSAMFYKSEDLQLSQAARFRYGVPESPFILSLCTLEPRKNIEMAIRAFIQLVQQQHLNNLSLVLVGNKGLRSDELINGIICSPDIKKRIIITGYVEDQDLAVLYSDALMFVYPSFYEGFGLPPLEAMQCGTPVITSNTTSLPEVVGDAGIMVNPTDLDSLCEAMWAVYSQPLLRQQLSEKALKRAGQFSWKQCAEKTMGAYKASLSS